MLSSMEQPQNVSTLFSSERVLNLLKLILAGSPLPEVLTIIARLVESQGEGTICTIWLPDEDGKQLRCVAAPSLAGFGAHVGPTLVGPKGASCGTAAYRREPVYFTDILSDAPLGDYRHPFEPFWIFAVWSRPLLTSEGKVVGTFAILYREARSPGEADLQLIESASHIAGIAIERHINQEKLRLERDRLRLVLENTNSISSKLDLRRLVEVLSTSLLRVTRCDFCALLLPDDSGELRTTILYNPEAQGSLCDGTIMPIHGSICGKAFRTGRTQHFDHIAELRYDPESFGNNGVVGVLTALKRSEKAFEREDVVFLEQVARQVAVAVENALEYEKAIRDRDKETKRILYLEEELRAEFGPIVG